MQAIKDVVNDIDESDLFRRRFERIITDSLTKAHERPVRDEDLYDLLMILMDEEYSREGVIT